MCLFPHVQMHRPHTVAGCILKFIPPYSLDFNPIEESFSAGEEDRGKAEINTDCATVKSWIQWEYCHLINSENPITDLYEACGVVTVVKARGWFSHSGYR